MLQRPYGVKDVEVIATRVTKYNMPDEVIGENILELRDILEKGVCEEKATVNETLIDDDNLDDTYDTVFSDLNGSRTSQTGSKKRKGQFQAVATMTHLTGFQALLKLSVKEDNGNTVDVTVRLYGPNTEYVINREWELQAQLWDLVLSLWEYLKTEWYNHLYMLVH
ncbi:hypothetical protein Tco_0474513 [Tanacetum coccineum]